ncbi:MAG: hypothetical protein WBI58_08365, partial [Dysgonamonadaceae bacterium]
SYVSACRFFIIFVATSIFIYRYQHNYALTVGRGYKCLFKDPQNRFWIGFLNGTAYGRRPTW